MSHRSSSGSPKVARQQPVTEDSIKFLEHHLERRHVAKRACLACREKKIKCDGELQSDESGNKSYGKCSNCASSGTECVFVPSKRGGRRRKNFSVDSATTQSHDYSSFANDQSLKRQHFDPERRFETESAPSMFTSDAEESFRPAHHQPPPGKFGSKYLPPPFAGYDDPGKWAGSKEPRYGKYPSKDMPYSEPYFYYGHPPDPPPPGPHLPNHGPPLLRRLEPPSLPPPPPGAFSSYHPPFHRMHRHCHHHRHPRHHHHHHHPDHYFDSHRVPYGFYPPPSPGRRSSLSYSDSDSRVSGSMAEELTGKSTLLPPLNHAVGPHSVDENSGGITEDWVNRQKQIQGRYPREDEMSITSAPTISGGQTSKHPKYTKSELEKYGLPPWNVIYTMVQLFYRYVHLSYQVLPNLKDFLERFFLTDENVAILSAMFEMTVRYINPNEIEDKKFLDESYWLHNYYKYRHNLSVEAELLILTMTCTSGEDDQLHRCFRLIKSSGYLDVLKRKSQADYNEMLDISTDRQLKDRELLIRCVWNVYKFQTYRRANYGYPYHKHGFFKLPEQLELPLDDIVYYRESASLESFKSAFKKAYYSDSINLNDPASDNMPDSMMLILSCHYMDEVMDNVAENALLTENVIKLDSQLQKMASLPNFRPYTIENNRLLIDATVLLSCFVNKLSVIILHSSICWSLLPLHPKDSRQCPNQVSLMNDFPSPLPDASQLASPTDFRQWKSFVACLRAAYDIASLVQLGEGICAESLQLDTMFPVSVGPCSADANEDCFSADPSLLAKSNVPPTTEPWVQYPSFCSVGVCNSVPILGSALLFLREHRFRVEKKQERYAASVLRGTEILAAWDVDAESAEFIAEKLRDNYITSKLRLISKYLSAIGKFRSGVRLAGTITDELISRLSTT
ncbi:hypothetical protein KL925_004980 [Ogataea polymorpha]|uniref:Uncharacterized protein n=1 Tax=Ogataea polymorpha TaxID=460523 RepID=A0A1B7SDI8_9ASCO|nr:uncharacterized protein OGAPODRAFT_17276 [Ogataea polymorpha]KAG7877564.1 hypothetical protein KL937_004759 [Ogataea polymorpha]KAG7906027.1 hypothetical protein KL906_004806 [Ogataea polymorpha]KAG7913960.1 hypothetical protein KL927_004939 [Ogataea polymorpha]KAG7924807.1 hypothetical protein KL925_004980 [Ogataea polymorpha]KAG7931970.1 hypothetical protein KL904_004717 [Ogataea polymorpha]